MAKAIYNISTMRIGKILIAIWIFILGILILIPIISFFQGELLGGIAFSIFLSAVLLNISIVISCFIGKTSQQIAKAGWVVLCVTEIAFVLAIADPQQADIYKDVELILGYTMFALSFPLGFISPLLLWIGGSLLSYTAGLTGRLDMIGFGIHRFYIFNLFLWLSYFLIGYLQWFKLLPLLIEKWRNMCHRPWKKTVKARNNGRE